MLYLWLFNSAFLPRISLQLRFSLLVGPFFLLKFFGHFSQSLKLFKAQAIPVLFNINRLLLGFQNPHQFLDLADCSLFRLIFVCIRQRLQYFLNIMHFLVNDDIYIFFQLWIISPFLANKYLTASQGEVLPISSKA